MKKYFPFLPSVRLWTPRRASKSPPACRGLLPPRRRKSCAKLPQRRYGKGVYMIYNAKYCGVGGRKTWKHCIKNGFEYASYWLYSSFSIIYPLKEFYKICVGSWGWNWNGYRRSAWNFTTSFLQKSRPLAAIIHPIKTWPLNFQIHC